MDVATRMAEPGLAAALSWLDRHAGSILDEAVTICAIPAPTFDEAERAEYVRRRFESLGLREVARDGAGNVRGLRPGSGTGRAVAVITHLDTVFPRDTDLTPRRDGGRLATPGIGDNSLSIAAALGIVAALDSARVVTAGDLWFVATTGEEGLGDLKGMRACMADLRERIGAVVVIDGFGLGRIVHEAVGSRRYRVTFTARGGHSWSHFPAPSAIHIMARAIADISRLEVPASPKTTFNVGVVSGGTTVNTIAAEAGMLVDMRSVDAGCLADLERRVLAIVERQAREGDGHARLELVGDRPAGSIAATHPLVRTCQAIRGAFGIASCGRPASTEANIPLALGIPAVCVSVTEGENEHRLDEYIETAPLPTGLKMALLTCVLATEPEAY